jgi:hypothetical protein
MFHVTPVLGMETVANAGILASLVELIFKLFLTALNAALLSEPPLSKDSILNPSSWG